MKKIIISILVALSLTACKEEDNQDVKVTVEVSQKIEDLTVYDYLINEPLMRSTLDDCISGKLSKYSDVCCKVKKANTNLDNFKLGIISEERLKQLGKK